MQRFLSVRVLRVVKTPVNGHRHEWVMMRAGTSGQKSETMSLPTSVTCCYTVSGQAHCAMRLCHESLTPRSRATAAAAPLLLLCHAYISLSFVGSFSHLLPIAMDDATIDADLFGDPSSNAFSDHILGREEALVEEAAAAAAERRRFSESQDARTEPEWRTKRRKGAQLDVSTMLDLRALDYVEDVDVNLHCPICHSPLVSPVKLKCDHVFCDECVRNALECQSNSSSKSCPSCRGRTDISCIGPVTKIVTRILDDLKVKCPYRSQGCLEFLPRGTVQDHVDLYCGWGETDCPADDCDKRVQRRFAEGRCRHGSVSCEECQVEVPECDLDVHRTSSCKAWYRCLDCQEWMHLSQATDHLSICPEATANCTAKPYGCDFTTKRNTLGAHLSTCPLAKLTPFLTSQQARLDEHEAALQHFRRKNRIYEDGLASVQDTLQVSLEEPSLSNNQNASEQMDPAATHLLDLYESIQSEIMNIKNSVAELDAKMEVTALNQTLRAKEESLHRDAVEGKMLRQLHWLLSSRLQNQQRNQVPLRMGSEQGRSGAATASSKTQDGNISDGSSSGSGSNNGSGRKAALSPIRRMSDGGRQETKL
jgi:uncharacterized protein YukE